MEYSSSCNDEDVILKFSDDECSDRMDQTDNYGNIGNSRRDSKECENSQLLLDYVQLKQENYYEIENVKFNQIVKKNNEISVDDGSKQKFSSQYLTSPTVSPEKQQGISQNFGKNSISDKMINFAKLLNQILNAKVVIERMCVYSGTSEESAKQGTSLSGSRFRKSVQRYCPKCQTVTVDADRLCAKKSCPRCESALKYLCSKCNSKHYKTYNSLILHLSACGLADSTLKELNPSNFLRKKTQIDFSKEIIRYCSRCSEVDSSCKKWTKQSCQYCDLQLLYQCNKCKAQYNAKSALLYHMQSKCYPYQYKCNQCDFMSPIWENMRKHVIIIHLRVHFNTEHPTQVLNAKAVFRKLGKRQAENTVSQTVKVHTNVNLLDESDSAGERNCTKYVHRYCTTCNKTESVRNEDPSAKTCSDCKTAMTYLCIKCNEKQYECYSYLRIHLNRCKGSADATGMLENDLDRTKLNEEEKNKANLFLDRSQFIVKEFSSVNSTEKWSRHCLECGLVIARNYGCRCTCCKKWLYVCKKCNVKCSSYDKMAYHAKNYCFPTRQYKCTHCEFSQTSWDRMMKHFKFTHTDLPMIKCEFCSYETNIKSNLRLHLRRIHNEINKIFHCGSCSYSTKFERNLHRHEKLNH